MSARSSVAMNSAQKRHTIPQRPTIHQRPNIMAPRATKDESWIEWVSRISGYIATISMNVAKTVGAGCLIFMMISACDHVHRHGLSTFSAPTASPSPQAPNMVAFSKVLEKVDQIADMIMSSAGLAVVTVDGATTVTKVPQPLGG
ncbi:hypothetical protein VF21_02462 [Pseudogymnoascus sp. 05NY08]|nr:hypothetical protein VF21_02462 [Pseudogymnoascus sp. 05NY08]